VAEPRASNAAVATALTDRGTASELINKTPSLSETRVLASQLTEDIGGNRAEVRDLHESYDDLHKRSHDVEWRTRSAERAKASVATMLGNLAELGFAWRDVARLVGVSVPAIQKWRRGEKPSGDSRLKVANLLAACDIIAEHYMIEEVASWFEMPLVAHAPATPLDLYAANRGDLVFDFASGHADPEMLLTEFDPEWRERYRSDFEVFDAADGRRSIRMKD
jgi:transcriptional regulator with XRE-family HTH domain